MFTKAILLSEADFRSLVSDFIEMAREEFEGRNDLTLKEVEEFLGAAFEEVLGAYGVDEAMVCLEGEWREVRDGVGFVDVVRMYYGDLGEMLKDVIG
jgi:hypothetical protein